MKTVCFTNDRPSAAGQITLAPLPMLLQITPAGNAAREPLRHILLGSPAAVRQTIHLLHRLHYAETVLWSPILTIQQPLIITPSQGESMSLLQR